MKILFFCLISLFILTSCSQKVTLSTVEPAKVDRIAQMKKISVMPFENDDIKFASNLQASLAQKNVYGKPYFTVINRDKIDEILKEQKFQYSGLVDKKTTVKIGKLIGVQSIITGNITDASLHKRYYSSIRYRCVDKKCTQTREYYVRCIEGTYNLSVNMNISDVQFGDIAYATTLNQKTSYSHCSDYSGGLPGFNYIMNKLSGYIINDFISQISPTKINLRIELLEDPEIDYTNKQEDLLEYSLEYIKSKRYDKAEQLLSELLSSTNDKCFVAAYNLGVIKELQGEYIAAKQLYDLADELVLEPNEQINQAIIRIKKQLENKEIVKSQVEK